MTQDEKLKKQVLAFLQNHRTAAIATVSKRNEPQVAAVNYIMDDEFNLFFITRKGSRKFENLEHSKRVGILVGNDPKVPAVVQIQGNAEILPDSHYMANFISKQIDVNDAQWWPILKTRGLDFVLFKVTIDWLRWLNLDITGYPQTYMKDFQQVIP